MCVCVLWVWSHLVQHLLHSMWHDHTATDLFLCWTPCWSGSPWLRMWLPSEAQFGPRWATTCDRCEALLICKHSSEACGRVEELAHYLKLVRLLEKAMMSWIMYVVRSVTWGRAVKTQPCLASSPSRLCCVSEEPRWWMDGSDEQEVENEPTTEGAFPDWLLSLTVKMFLSIGWEKQKLKHT